MIQSIQRNKPRRTRISDWGPLLLKRCRTISQGRLSCQKRASPLVRFLWANHLQKLQRVTASQPSSKISLLGTDEAGMRASAMFLRAATAALLLTDMHAVNLLSWDDAYLKADKVLSQMTQEEKYSLMVGVGWRRVPVIDMGPQKKWWYSGNTPPVVRLNIPSLNMQDNAQGFKDSWYDMAGLATCWPSLLSFAATWNPVLVNEFAKALGEEFVGKGANVILGPSVNVHRIARGGRNFEYISGEDPYLGSRLTEAYVQGVQSTGVAAVVKHWVFNGQETHRHSESSVVDDRTAWELYYPPFQAAVDAGVAMVMCSYNKINGTYSCENSKTLQILKEKMGFRGFVQSDWFATHSTSVASGLDQEMPGTSDHFSSTELAKVNPALIDGSVRRILAVMHKLDLFNTTRASAPAKDWLMKDVRNNAHKMLARKAATESVVLLKNDHQILPISNATVKSIAVVGSPAIAKPNDPWLHPFHWMVPGDYYAGGGSGHVFAPNVVTPLAGIQQRAEQAGIRVVVETSDDAKDAVVAAAKADLTVIVAATTTEEGADRKSLALDNGANSIIEAVAKSGAKIVVVAQVPGAIVMPWRDSVDGIAVMFMGGQETGSAWASVLFGDHAPSGHLPLMMPATEKDTIDPSDSEEVIYSEGLATSYRNPNFTAAFPFGHGITYTRFEYGTLTSHACDDKLCLGLSIRNTGRVAGATVAQLYLEFPKIAQYPAPLLKGFQKTPLVAPGDSVDVTFRLSDLDLSYYRSGNRDSWVKAANLIAHVGESSVDIRQSLPIETQYRPSTWV